MKARVKSITYEAKDILSFELVPADGEDVGMFEPGSHIEIAVPGFGKRPYSLCNALNETSCYRLGILRTPDSRGGSKGMHERVKPGDVVDVSAPKNLFPLNMDVDHSILVAGGIGITPILTMAEALQAAGRSYELHYCAREPERTAFLTRVELLVQAGNAQVHYDRGNPENGLDLAGLIGQASDTSHVYFCGPPGFMNVLRDLTSTWPPERVHFEYFGADTATKSEQSSATEGPSEIHLAKSGNVITYDGVQTLLEALRGAGIECESSCEAGLCGSCKVGFLSGEPEHNDLILSDHERQHDVLLCCARLSKGPLVLDI